MLLHHLKSYCTFVFLLLNPLFLTLNLGLFWRERHSWLHRHEQLVFLKNFLSQKSIDASNCLNTDIVLNRELNQGIMQADLVHYVLFAVYLSHF